MRKNNEDYFVIDPELGLYLVADGMGGAQAGEYASKLAAQTVVEVVRSGGPPSRELLVRAFTEANSSVLQAASGDPLLEGMGTTLVALLECGPNLAIASVGDSRCYAFNSSGLALLTVDQTWVQEVGRRLGIAEEQLRGHPMRHVLTMAIGAQPSLKIHTSTLPRRPGVEFLLSTDGLHGVVDERTIAEILAGERILAAQCHYLIEAARKAGGPDNITVVLLRS